jgi:alkylation response protein AidB-like acyl-CoA dehydrogenase
VAGAHDAPATPVGGRLAARTPAGALLLDALEEVTPTLAEQAGVHDRLGAFPFDGLEALRAAGLLRAPAPVEAGGLGVGSLHDLVAASARVAEADPSLGIGVNMHLVYLHNLAMRRRRAIAEGRDRRVRAFTDSLEALVAEDAVLAAAISEPAQDVTHPQTRAVRTDRGWRVDGRKVFCTMAPAATVFYVAVAFADDEGHDRYGYALVPADTPGVRVHDDWDGLGMRASGSHAVSFVDVEIPSSALAGGFACGDASAYMERNLAAGVLHAAASLGIAEAARAQGMLTLHRRGGNGSRDAGLLTEIDVDLAATRAVVARAALLVDEHEDVATGAHGARQVELLFAETQAAKAFANGAAERITDRALALAGGAGYLAGSPFARLLRDARAGAFMHPLGANRIASVLSAIALEHEVDLR